MDAIQNVTAGMPACDAGTGAAEAACTSGTGTACPACTRCTTSTCTCAGRDGRHLRPVRQRQDQPAQPDRHARTATEGSVVIASLLVSKLSDQARADLRGEMIGFVFQSFSLIPVMTAHENVLLPLMLRGHLDDAALEEAEQRAADLLARLGLATQMRHYPAPPRRQPEPAGGDRARADHAAAAGGGRRTDLAPRQRLHAAGDGPVRAPPARTRHRVRPLDARPAPVQPGQPHPATERRAPVGDPVRSAAAPAEGAGMSPHRLALRTVLLGRPRTVLARAGHCRQPVRARPVRRPHRQHPRPPRIPGRHRRAARATWRSSARAPAQRRRADVRPRRSATRIRRIAEGSAGRRAGGAADEPGRHGLDRRALGRCSTAKASPRRSAGRRAGQAQAGVRNGIAVSSGQARSLGLRNGSNVTLTGAPPTRAACR